MNRLLVVLILLGTCTILGAQDLPSLTVAPSDVIRYPDSKDILNPVEKPSVKTTTSSKVVGPLIASTPVPATSPKAALVTTPAPPRSEHGWFLVWSVRGDEAATQTWWTTQTPWSTQGEPRRTQTAVDAWEFAWGPLDSTQWALVLKGPPEGTRLVKR